MNITTLAWDIDIGAVWLCILMVGAVSCELMSPYNLLIPNDLQGLASGCMLMSSFLLQGQGLYVNVTS